jgi:L-ascorbate metabolism protein UlaG (beta-lactamase superfamily)
MNAILSTIICITYLGTASFLIEYDHVRILTDPGDLFTNRLTIEKARSIGKIDLVIVTHTDFDHVNRLQYIPGASSLPVFGPADLRRVFPEYNIFSGDSYNSGCISVKKIKSIHGMRHDVEHTSFIIKLADLVICFLGDAYRVPEKLSEQIDLLFVTVGGMEANAENGAKIASGIMPGIVIPMHWEGLFRSDNSALQLRTILKNTSLIECYIPQYDKRFEVIKGDRVIIR